MLKNVEKGSNGRNSLNKDINKKNVKKTFKKISFLNV